MSHFVTWRLSFPLPPLCDRQASVQISETLRQPAGLVGVRGRPVDMLWFVPGNKKMQGHWFLTRWPSIVQRLERWWRWWGGSVLMCFMGWRWWLSAQPLTPAWSLKGQQTHALFQWTLNHEGQLVGFQFIKWIWAFALWSRLVSNDVMSHPYLVFYHHEQWSSDPG